MKSVKLLFILVFLPVLLAFAQDMQYVSKKSGDSLWVKDDSEFSGINTLSLLMATDSLAPASRVYVLRDGGIYSLEGGIYSLENNPVTSTEHRTIIMGKQKHR